MFGIGPKVFYSKPTKTMAGVEASYTFGSGLRKQISASFLASVEKMSNEDMTTTQELRDDPFDPEGSGWYGTTSGFKVDRKSLAALLGFSLGNDTFMGGVEAGVLWCKDDVNYTSTDFFHATEGGTSYDNLTVNQNETVRTYVPMAGLKFSYNPIKNIGIVGAAGYIFGDREKISSELGAKLETMSGPYGSLSVMFMF